MSRFVFCPFLALMVMVGPSANAQDAVLPKHEFRGAWIASVANLDWPTSQGFTTQEQQDQLIERLDGLKAAGINAVMLQIRPECDALYDSPFEPWSIYLTGESGRAPDPYYDPLAFAVEEAHKRGMELHAWFNPFRAVRSAGAYTFDSTHVAIAHPEWLITINNHSILNPGIPDVRAYVVDVIMDVVRRYDIDGVHFDDYFYPYPPNAITNEDQETYDTYKGGFSSIKTWRTFNINVFVRTVYESIMAEKPWVKFGISPFGIWRSGVPAGISGLSAVDVLFSDAVNWMQQEWVDYLVPQLYWPFGGGQDYGKLAPWWASESNGRHIYTGHGLYRSDPNTFSGSLFSASEVPNQVRFNRMEDGIQGSVHFRARNITSFSSKGFADTLKSDLYRYPAITPSHPWKDGTPPPPPTDLAYEWTDDVSVTLSWTAPVAAKRASDSRRFAVYRILSTGEPDFDSALQEARHLVALTGETTLVDKPLLADDPYYYVVTSISANAAESEPSNSVSLEGRAVSLEAERVASGLQLYPNFPNPFSTRTTIRFRLDAASGVTLKIYNMLGQEVDRLIDGTSMPSGEHQIEWDAGSLASGTYYYALEANGRHQVKGMVLLR